MRTAGACVDSPPPPPRRMENMSPDSPAVSPWLSVLIPVYNVEHYLGACLDSVLAQGDTGIEIVLLDDASPDGSAEIAARYHDRHPATIKVITLSQNGGLAAARNALLHAARGRYLWFLDSDDEMCPGALRGLRRIVDAHAPDLVMCDFRLLRTSSRLHHRLRGEGHRASFHGPADTLSTDRNALVTGLLESRQLHAWSKIATAEVWRAVSFPAGRYFEDMAVIPQLVANVRTWYYVPATWVGYRQRGDSILANMTSRKSNDMLLSLQDLHGGLHAQPVGLSPRALMAVDYFCLRTFASLARKSKSDDVELDRDCRTTLRRVFPQGVRAVLGAYTKRGWWLRAVRAQRSLKARGWV